MSGPVDVLGWIAGKARAATAMQVVHAGEAAGAGVRKREADEAAAVHAAVAELIEAGNAFWRATDYGRKACSGEVAKRFDAALANVGPQS